MLGPTGGWAARAPSLCGPVAVLLADEVQV